MAEEMEQPRSCVAIAVAMVMTMVVLPYNCMAMTYTVGGPLRWNLGVNYVLWTSGKTFSVGDDLFFTYISPDHDVMEVTESAYNSCLASNIIKTYTGGSTTITLDSEGDKYYICSTAGHCKAGMRVAITVAAAASEAPPPSSAPPPSTGSTEPPPPSSAAMASSFIQTKDCVVLVGSLVLAAFAVRML